MADAQLDVVGVGNAIVDVIAKADEALIERLELSKGTMTLIDSDDADRLYGEMGGVLKHPAAQLRIRWQVLPHLVAPALISARCGTASSAVCSATTSRQPGSITGRVRRPKVNPRPAA